MREARAQLDEQDLKKKAAILTVTGRYRESLNIVIYLMDRRSRDKALPVIMPRPIRRNQKTTKY